MLGQTKGSSNRVYDAIQLVTNVHITVAAATCLPVILPQLRRKHVTAECKD